MSQPPSMSHPTKNPAPKTSSLPKRFYKVVSIKQENKLYQILLDGRPAKTKSGLVLGAHSIALAKAIQKEWDAQETHIDFLTMPMMRMQSTILEINEEMRQAWEGEVNRFLRSDLLCYRAASPETLVEMEANAWDPFLRRVKGYYGLSFNVTNTVLNVEQPSRTLDQGARIISNYNDAEMLCVRRITELTGSAILGLCVGAGFQDKEAIIDAGRVDEDYQSSQWGVDAESLQRMEAVAQEIELAMQFYKLVNET